MTSLAFQFASTNLVWELGLVLWVLIGWQFTLASTAKDAAESKMFPSVFGKATGAGAISAAAAPVLEPK